MSFGGFKCLCRQIDSGDLCVFTDQRFAQYAAAATDIQDGFALQDRMACYPLETDWVKVVQWPERAIWFPPAVGDCVEFPEFGLILIHGKDGVVNISGL